MSKFQPGDELTPPSRDRLERIGPANRREDGPLDTDITALDMLPLWKGMVDESERSMNVARDVDGNTCYPISNRTTRRLVAMVRLQKLWNEGGEDPDFFITEDRDITSDDSTIQSLEDWQVEVASAARTVGVDSAAELITIAPIVFSANILGNLPTHICGSDGMDAIDQINDAVSLNSLDDLFASVGDDDDSPLSFKWAIWVIFIMFLLEFSLLFVLRWMATVFRGWPMKMLYTFVRRLAIHVIREIRDYAFEKILKVPGLDEKDDETIRQKQIQQILLFADANPLIAIGTKLGIV